MLPVGWWCVTDYRLLSPCVAGPCILPSVQLFCCPLLLHINGLHLFCALGFLPTKGGLYFYLRMNDSSDDSSRLKTPEDGKPFDDSSLC